MPALSQAQYGLARAVLAEKSTKMPHDAAKEMVEKTHDVGSLPRHVGARLQHMRTR